MHKLAAILALVTVALLVGLLSGCQMQEPKMSYQGQLTDPAGNPVADGNYEMVFRLYDADDTELWTETQTVPVSGGLFNVALGEVTEIPAPTFAQQLWLGVEVAGDGEMAPRQKLLGAPYAMSLMPGAVVIGDIPSTAQVPSVLNLFNYNDTNGGNTLGVLSYGATGVLIDGDGYGDYGLHIEDVEHGAIITSTALGLKVTVSESDGDYGIMGRTESIGSTAWAVRGDSDTTGAVLGRATGTGYYAVRGSNADGIGGYFWNSTTSYYSLRAQNIQGDSAPGLYVRGTSMFTGAKTGYVAELCQNTGPEVLEPGDVVVIVGYSEAVLGEIPVMLVRKAREASATGVVGIVDVRQVVNPSSEGMFSDPESTSSPEAEVHVAEGPIRQGDYLLVVTLGAYKGIKVDASLGRIRPGDLLTASSNGGYAMKAAPLTVDSVTFYAPGTIIGKALGSLDEGTGVIPVFVSAQ